jgi:hypothetical protein
MLRRNRPVLRGESCDPSFVDAESYFDRVDLNLGLADFSDRGARFEGSVKGKWTVSSILARLSEAEIMLASENLDLKRRGQRLFEKTVYPTKGITYIEHLMVNRVLGLSISFAIIEERKKNRRYRIDMEELFYGLSQFLAACDIRSHSCIAGGYDLFRLVDRKLVLMEKDEYDECLRKLDSVFFTHPIFSNLANIDDNEVFPQFRFIDTPTVDEFHRKYLSNLNCGVPVHQKSSKYKFKINERIGSIEYIAISVLRELDTTRLFRPFAIWLRTYWITFKLQNIACYREMILDDDRPYLTRVKTLLTTIYLREFNLDEILSCAKNVTIHLNDDEPMHHYHKYNFIEYDPGDERLLDDRTIDFPISWTKEKYAPYCNIDMPRIYVIHRLVAELSNRLIVDRPPALRFGQHFISEVTSYSMEMIYCLFSYIVHFKRVPTFIYCLLRENIMKIRASARGRIDAMLSANAFFISYIFVNLTVEGNRWMQYIQKYWAKLYGNNKYFYPKDKIPCNLHGMEAMWDKVYLNTNEYKRYCFGNMKTGEEFFPRHLLITDKQVYNTLNRLKKYLIGYMKGKNKGLIMKLTYAKKHEASSILHTLKMFNKSLSDYNLDYRADYGMFGLEYYSSKLYEMTDLNYGNNCHLKLRFPSTKDNIKIAVELGLISTRQHLFHEIFLSNPVYKNLPYLLYDFDGKPRTQLFGQPSQIITPCRWCQDKWLDFDGKSCCLAFEICPICTVLCNDGFLKYPTELMIAGLRTILFRDGPEAVFNTMSNDNLMRDMCDEMLDCYVDHMKKNDFWEYGELLSKNRKVIDFSLRTLHAVCSHTLQMRQRCSKKKR